MKEVDIDRIASEYFDDKESEHEMDEVFDLAKKALEERKADVLNKIRTEIEQNAYPIVHGINNHEKGMTLYGILQVIDKYR